MPTELTHTTGADDELISDDVKEIISHRAGWIVRRGNSIFLLVLLLLLALTFIIKYPDMINASSRLVALNPPKLITAKVEGKLVRLFMANDQEVKKDQHIALMESTADYNQVMILQTWINNLLATIKNNNYGYIVINQLPELVNLGELQPGYQTFQNQLELTKQTLASGYFQKKKDAIQRDLTYLGILKANTQSQKSLQENDKALQQREFEAYESLAKDKVIAPLELNQYKSRVIAKQQNLEQLNAQITTSEMSIQNKEKEMLDLSKQVTDNQQQFRTAALDLKSQIEKWIQQYVLVAPVDGKLLFVSSLQENELVGNGQPLFYVQPDETKVFAELTAGQQGLGKIKIGQKVFIKVESYPSNEFGYLEGDITHIASIPTRRDSFLIKVQLPHGLTTNFNKTLLFRNNLTGHAEIIADDRKLISRLTGELYEILNR